MAEGTSLAVDLDSLDASLFQEEVFIDPNVDPFASPPPPPDGTHRAKLKLLKDGDSYWQLKKIGKGKKGEGTPFLAGRIQANVVAEGERHNNLAAFDNVNTLVFDGKSRIAGIVAAAGGQKLGGKVSPPDQAAALEKALAGEPIVKIRGRWTASEKLPDETYSTFLRGMKAFPPRKIRDEEGNEQIVPGEYNHVVTGPKTGADVTAQFEILEYLVD